MFLTLGLRFRGTGKYIGVGVISENISACHLSSKRIIDINIAEVGY
jgi:hypothetical protein